MHALLLMPLNNMKAIYTSYVIQIEVYQHQKLSGVACILTPNSKMDLG